MRFSDTLDKIIPALLKARSSMKPAAKSGYNKFDKYAYSMEEDWHNAVMGDLLANDLVLVFSEGEPTNLPERKTASGKSEYPVQVIGTATLFHISGQWIEVGGAGQGQDRADKGLYQATTGMTKDLYALMFALPKSDDPEAVDKPETTSKPTATPPAKTPPPTPIADKLAWIAKTGAAGDFTKLNAAWIKLGAAPLALGEKARMVEAFAAAGQSNAEFLQILMAGIGTFKFSPDVEAKLFAFVARLLETHNKTE